MPRHYSADSADDDVAAQAYAAAKKLTNNTTILLALFETGLVESNFHNLGNLGAKNDHDSLGYLQQRPSAGWKNPTDIPTATKSFINKAKSVLAQHPNWSAGQVAAEVQRPRADLRGRYQDASAAAQTLLAQASAGKLKTSDTDAAAAPGGSTSTKAGSSGGGSDTDTGSSGDSTTSAALKAFAAAGGLNGITGAAQAVVDPMTQIGAVAEQLYKFMMPSNLMRAAALVAGAFFILFGVVLLTREVRNT